MTASLMHEAGTASCKLIKHLHKAWQSRLAKAKASSHAFTDRPAGATSKFTFAANPFLCFIKMRNFVCSNIDSPIIGSVSMICS